MATIVKSSLVNFMSCVLFLSVFSILPSTECQTYVDQDCLDLLPKGYKKYVPPKFKGKAIDITYSFLIYNLDEINEATMDFRLHGYLYSTWLDERLVINTTIINNRCFDHLWVPDHVFEQAKTTLTFGRQNTFLDINEKKIIRSSQRYSFKVSCMMHFENYPFDTQQCIFTISLMTTPDNLAKIRWGDGTLYQPFVFARKMVPLQFQLGEVKTYETTEDFDGANYTYLYLDITLIRRLMGSIVNIYAPSTLIVFVSWVTFWLRLDAAPARVSLSITSLLTLCTQAQQNKSQLPPLNYITATDIWLFGCIFMVFASLVEFAISYNVFMKKKSQTSEPSVRLTSEIQDFQKFRKWTVKKPLEYRPPGVMMKKSITLKKNIFRTWFSKLKAAGPDNICQKVFPLLFFIFATVYWVHYLQIYRQY